MPLFLSRRIVAVLWCLMLPVSQGSIPAGDWPGFRGPAANGHVKQSSAPIRWSQTEGLLWKTDLPGPGASSPIVQGGRVYLTCYSGYGLSAENAGDPNALTRHALCFDLSNGKQVWEREIPSPRRETKFAGPYITMHGYASHTPATDGERVYFFLGAAGVAAFTMTGEPVWQADVGANVHAWGSGTSPVLYENLVIVNASAESDSLVALDKATGERVWTYQGMARSWNTPLLVEVPDGPPELVVSLRGKVLGLDPATGKELWAADGIQAAELCPSPVAHEGVVFILGHPGGQAMAVRAGGRGNVTASHVLWRLNKGSNVCSPIYHEGHLYWTSDKKGIAYCVDAKTGKIVYEQRIAPRPGFIYASPVLVDGRIYYVSRENGTFVVAAKPDYELLAHNLIPDDPSPFTGSPAVVDGKMILRSDRFLYCLGTSD